MVSRNDSIILAMMKDGNELEGMEWPLTLVWDVNSGNIPGMKKVKGVVMIRIIVGKNER